MKNYKIKNSLKMPEGPKAQANKTGINLMIFISIFVKIVSNTMLYMIMITSCIQFPSRQVQDHSHPHSLHHSSSFSYHHCHQQGPKG